jgi:RND family efflux transporter MFP subunit
MSAAVIRETRSQLMPKITFTESAVRGNDPVFVFGARLRQQNFTLADLALNRLNTPGPISNFSSRFSGQWSLFDGLQSWFGVSRAKYMQQAIQQQLDRTDQELMYQAVKAYFGVLLAQRQEKVAEDALKTAQGIEASCRARVESGMAVDSDLLSARVVTARRKQELIQAQEYLSLTRAQLALALGMPADTAYDPQETLEERQFPTATATELESKALDKRPDLKRVESERSAQAKSVSMARGALAPRVDVFGSWETDSPSPGWNGGSNWIAGAELQFDLFDGGGKRAHIAHERAAQDKAAAMHDAFRDQIRLEVRKAYFEYDAARQQIQVAHGAIAEADESFAHQPEPLRSRLENRERTAAGGRGSASCQGRLLAGGLSLANQLRRRGTGNWKPFSKLSGGDAMIQKSKFVAQRFLLGILVSCLAGLSACSNERQHATAPPELVRDLSLLTVRKTMAPDYNEATGTVRAAQSAQLSSQAVGVITRVNVHEGDQVRRGEVLITIVAAQQRAAYDSAKAGLIASQESIAGTDADYALADATMKRYQMLFEKKSVSPQEYDEVKARRVAAKARHHVAAASGVQRQDAVPAANADVGFTRITAPFDGLVVAKLADAGTLAAPGIPLLTIEDPTRFRLEAIVDESQIGAIQVREAVPVVIDSLGNETITGKVVQIVPAADPGEPTFSQSRTPANHRFTRAVWLHASRGEREVMLVPQNALIHRGQLTVCGSGGK